MARRTDIERRHIDWPADPADFRTWPFGNTPDDLAADALIDWVEDCEVPARFVPDCSDESFKNAA
jgi:hypothetical protein